MTYPYDCGDIVHPQGVGSGGVRIMVSESRLKVVLFRHLKGTPEQVHEKPTGRHLGLKRSTLILRYQVNVNSFQGTIFLRRRKFFVQNYVHKTNLTSLITSFCLLYG